MQNLFYERQISRVFDLKGSTRSRYVTVIPDGAAAPVPSAAGGSGGSGEAMPEDAAAAAGAAATAVGALTDGSGRLAGKSDGAAGPAVGTAAEGLSHQQGPVAPGFSQAATMAASAAATTVAAVGAGVGAGAAGKKERVPQVLLDENFLEFTRGHPLPLLDHFKVWFQTAILNDTQFLSVINVVDYSIVVGMDE
ncbi:unnamed protein product, partial [Phaeothamnion confervicola]